LSNQLTYWLVCFLVSNSAKYFSYCSNMTHACRFQVQYLTIWTALENHLHHYLFCYLKRRLGNFNNPNHSVTILNFWCMSNWFHPYYLFLFFRFHVLTLSDNHYFMTNHVQNWRVCQPEWPLHKNNLNSRIICLTILF
jgi:hypothetical protein